MTNGDVSDFMTGGDPNRFKVMVPLDGSQHAEGALSYLSALVPLGSLEVYLIGVIDDTENQDEELLGRERNLLEAYLKERAASLHSGIASCQSVVAQGNPAPVLMEEADRLNADLTLISSHGRSGIERWRMGSVADKLVRGAACDTLVIGKDANITDPQLKKILVPLDGSELAAQALPLALRFVSGLGAELHLLQVVSAITMASTVPIGMSYSSPGIYEALIKGAQSYMATVQEKTGATRSSVIVGLPADALMIYAEENSIDLIIMTSHGRGGIVRTALGSVTDRLLGGRAPVLVVRGRG